MMETGLISSHRKVEEDLMIDLIIIGGGPAG